jgi:hypothetical protein
VSRLVQVRAAIRTLPSTGSSLRTSSRGTPGPRRPRAPASIRGHLRRALLDFDRLTTAFAREGSSAARREPRSSECFCGGNLTGTGRGRRGTRTAPSTRQSRALWLAVSHGTNTANRTLARRASAPSRGIPAVAQKVPSGQVSRLARCLPRAHRSTSMGASGTSHRREGERRAARCDPRSRARTPGEARDTSLAVARSGSSGMCSTSALSTRATDG